MLHFNEVCVTRTLCCVRRRTPVVSSVTHSLMFIRSLIHTKALRWPHKKAAYKSSQMNKTPCKCTSIQQDVAQPYWNRLFPGHYNYLILRDEIPSCRISGCFYFRGGNKGMRYTQMVKESVQRRCSLQLKQIRHLKWLVTKEYRVFKGRRKLILFIHLFFYTSTI